MKLGLDTVIKGLQRKEYIKVMEETDYGWKNGKHGEYKHIGCPADLPFIRLEEQPHEGMCLTKSCKECWEYVLNNKKW